MPVANASAVAAGAVMGAISRYQVGELAGAWIAKDPTRRGAMQGWHTAGINVAGSFVLGSLAGIPTFAAAAAASATGANAGSTGSTTSTPTPASTTTASSVATAKPQKAPTSSLFPTNLPQGLSPRTKLLLGVGFCGSFTTFSTFTVDVAKWVAEGQMARASGYVLANNLGGFMAAATGMMLTKKLYALRPAAATAAAGSVMKRTK